MRWAGLRPARGVAIKSSGHGDLKQMVSPCVVGIPACTKLVSHYVQHATPARYGAALIAAAITLVAVLWL